VNGETSKIAAPSLARRAGDSGCQPFPSLTWQW
jgi:hypothetical protein